MVSTTPDDPDQPLAIGVEIGEHAMRFTATLSAQSHARQWQSGLPNLPSPEDAIAAINDLIAHALREGAPDPRTERPVALGISLWDGADAARGVVRRMRYVPGWEDFPLAERLARRWGGPVRLIAAPDAAALAEARVGAGSGLRSILYVLLARSVWSSVIVEGRVVAGSQGGQLAHWRARSDGPRCSCGVYGHLEPLAAAQALVRNMIGRAAASDASTAAMLAISAGRAEAMSARAVVQLAAQDDPIAAAVVADALDALAPALANLIAVLGPSAIVLGGPLAQAGEAFWGPLRARVSALCESFTQAPPLLGGTLEPHAAVIGAQLLASAGDAHIVPDW